MAELSISKAWDQTTEIIARDGRLIGAVALALIALPATVSGLVAPHGGSDPSVPIWGRILVFLATLVTVAGQLALIRLAIGPSVSVGEAIAHGMRRLPIYFVAALIVFCALVLLAVPFLIVLVVAQVPIDETAIKQSPTALLLALVYLIVAFVLGVRLLMMSSVASAEAVGPIAIIRRSWELTSGHWLRMLGFLLIFAVGALVVFAAVGAAVGIVAGLLIGPVDPLSASALVVALFMAIANATVTGVFAVMLARIYVQLSGRPSVASKRGA